AARARRPVRHLRAQLPAPPAPPLLQPRLAPPLPPLAPPRRPLPHPAAAAPHRPPPAPPRAPQELPRFRQRSGSERFVGGRVVHVGDHVVLPHQDAQLIAQLVEIIRLVNHRAADA